jgi:spermidine synthase
LNGLHLIGDLYDCRCESSLLKHPTVPLQLIRELCASVGLTVVGERAHEFTGGGYTLAVLLAESHVTLHTWPEYDMVALDVYVCNHTQDNSGKARALSRGMTAVFASQRHAIKDIERGEIAEPFNSAQGSLVKGLETLTKASTNSTQTERNVHFNVSTHSRSFDER